MENEQLIHDYEHGKLSASEKVAFEKRVINEFSLAQELEEYKDIRAAIKLKEREDLKNILQELEEKEEVPEEQEDTISFGKRYRHIYAAAAVIIFAIIAFQFLQKEPSSQDLYASFYQPYPNTLQPIVRGESAEDINTQAFVAYEAKQFDKAASLFKESLSQEYDADIAFYRAMSLLNNSQDLESLRILASLKSKESSYQPQLYWYSALIALKNDEKNKALDQLDSLKLLKSDFKKGAVLKLQKQLQD